MPEAVINHPHRSASEMLRALSGWYQHINISTFNIATATPSTNNNTTTTATTTTTTTLTVSSHQPHPLLASCFSFFPTLFLQPHRHLSCSPYLSLRPPTAHHSWIMDVQGVLLDIGTSAALSVSLFRLPFRLSLSLFSSSCASSLRLTSIPRPESGNLSILYVLQYTRARKRRGGYRVNARSASSSFRVYYCIVCTFLVSSSYPFRFCIYITWNLTCSYPILVNPFNHHQTNNGNKHWLT